MVGYKRAGDVKDLRSFEAMNKETFTTSSVSFGILEHWTKVEGEMLI